MSPQEADDWITPAAAPASGGAQTDDWVTPSGAGPRKEESHADYWHGVGADDPNYKYGQILPVKKNIATGETSFALPEMGRSVARGIGDLYDYASGRAAGEKPEMTPEAVGAVAAFSPASAAMGLQGNAAVNAVRSAGDLAAEKSAPITAPITEKFARPPKLTPSQEYANTKDVNTSFVEGMNSTANQMKDAYGGIYNKGREISQGVVRNEPKMKGTTEALLDDVKEDPAMLGSQNSSQAIRDLQSVVDSFDSKGNIPLDSITLLQRRVNDLYSPSMSDARGKIYATLNNQLRDATKRAKVDNPEWGQVMDSGNNLFKNYKNTFEEDAVASRRWGLSDKEDYERSVNSEDPLGAPLSTATKNKIMDIANINSVPEYEAMMRRLPPELQDPYTEEVMKNNIDNGSLLKKLKLAKTAYDAAKLRPSAIADLARMGEKSSGFNPAMATEEPHVLDAIKYHEGNANSAYNNWLEKPKPPLPEPISDMPGYNLEAYAGSRKAGSRKDTGPTDLSFNLGRPTPPDPYLLPANSGAKSRIPPTSKMPSLSGINSQDMDKEMDNLLNFQNPGYAQGGRVNTEPTEAQKSAGNYKKEHIKFHGLDISIENPKGSKRSGVGDDGKPWESSMAAHYGYVKGTEGADGDHVDVYVGPHKESRRVYVIDQKNHGTGKFDEHKALLGFISRTDAEKAYRGSFSDKKDRIMKVTRLSVDEFKDWLRNGDTKKAIGKGSLK